jgi:tRNA-splicing ligase RtcB
LKVLYLVVEKFPFQQKNIAYQKSERGYQMAEQNYIYDGTQTHPIKHWTKGVEIDEGAKTQLHNIANLPFIHSHIAVMPDVHWGVGATIGSVIATKGAIVPAAVGVDIGCGMMAVKTSLTASDLPDDLKALRSDIERSVPHGRTNGGKRGDRGGWHNLPLHTTQKWASLQTEYEHIIEKHPKAKAHNTVSHLGTLGTGNHFIEICLDENDCVWAMLHSGSRGCGNKIGMYFINKAKEEMERYFIGDHLPDKDLSYFVEHTEIFDDYVEAVGWAQKFARINREIMMEAVLQQLKIHTKDFHTLDKAVNCHHNYINQENHFGSNVWVTRKGAVRARDGDLGIIPGSMGTGSFIVRGLGNQDSFCSCSHGAGRVMSRTQAKKEISMEQHATAMEGIEARLDKDVIDESPAAYKDIGAVMKAQDDLVEIVARLRQVVNVKG